MVSLSGRADLWSWITVVRYRKATQLLSTLAHEYNYAITPAHMVASMHTCTHAHIRTDMHTCTYAHMHKGRWSVVSNR